MIQFPISSPAHPSRPKTAEPAFGSRRPTGYIQLAPSGDSFEAARIGDAVAAQRRHAKHEIFGLPGLHVNFNVVTTKPSGSPTKTKERYWNVEIPKLGGGRREVWRGDSKVDDMPRAGHPGRLMTALQGLLGRRDETATRRSSSRAGA